MHREKRLKLRKSYGILPTIADMAKLVDAQR